MNFKKADHDVISIQSLLQLNPNDAELISKERAACSEFHISSIAYEKYLQQKSKVTWLKLGDDSTGFFHASIKSRGLQNRILSYFEQGVRINDFEKVKSHFLNHFKSFISSSSKASGIVDHKFILQWSALNLDQQLAMVKPFTDKEVKKALFSIGSSKSPGLDGSGAGFFKASWTNVVVVLSTNVQLSSFVIESIQFFLLL